MGAGLSQPKKITITSKNGWILR